MYKFILPFRYMFKKRISYLALLTVVLCVFIVVVVMTVMAGLVEDFKQKNHSFVGDCVLGTESLVGFGYYEDFMRELASREFVQSVTPVIRSYGLINVKGSRQSRGVEIIGIEPVGYSRTTGFGEDVYYHRRDVANVFVPSYNPELPGCVPGIDLVLERNSRGEYSPPDSPWRLGLAISSFPLTPKGALSKAGLGLVNTRTFYYSDHSRSGLATIDSSAVFLPFDESQKLCGMDRPIKRTSFLYIKFQEGTGLSEGCGKVRSMWSKYVSAGSGRPAGYLLETVAVQSWKQNRRSFIAAMEKEQTIMTMMFILVGITTVFIVFVVFYMIVSHKSKDIGIFKSVGASGGDILQIYSIFAFFVGFLGSVFGSLFGWLFLRYINDIEAWLYGRFGFQLWDRSIYAIGEIPNRLESGLLLVIMASAIFACLLGAYLPSRKGSKLRPVQTLQVNQL